MQNYKPNAVEAQKPILMSGKRISWAELSALFVMRKALLLSGVGHE